MIQDLSTKLFQCAGSEYISQDDSVFDWSPPIPPPSLSPETSTSSGPELGSTETATLSMPLAVIKYGFDPCTAAFCRFVGWAWPPPPLLVPPTEEAWECSPCPCPETRLVAEGPFCEPTWDVEGGFLLVVIPPAVCGIEFAAWDGGCCWARGGGDFGRRDSISGVVPTKWGASTGGLPRPPCQTLPSASTKCLAYIWKRRIEPPQAVRWETYCKWTRSLKTLWNLKTFLLTLLRKNRSKRNMAPSRRFLQLQFLDSHLSLWSEGGKQSLTSCAAAKYGQNVSSTQNEISRFITMEGLRFFPEALRPWAGGRAKNKGKQTCGLKFDEDNPFPTVTQPALILWSSPKSSRRRWPWAKCSMMWYSSSGFAVEPVKEIVGKRQVSITTPCETCISWFNAEGQPSSSSESLYIRQLLTKNARMKIQDNTKSATLHRSLETWVVTLKHEATFKIQINPREKTTHRNLVLQR